LRREVDWRRERGEERRKEVGGRVWSIKSLRQEVEQVKMVEGRR
jgi:hypothetical protein